MRVGVGVAVAVSIAAALLMMQASHWLVHRKAQKDLGALAQRVLERGESAVAEATLALRAVQDLGPQDYCTARGTERFSQAMSRTHRLRAVGGLAPDNRACSSVGARSLPASLPAARWIDSEYSVWLHMGLELGLPEGTIVISLGGVFAAIDPFLLVDAVAGGDVQIALLDAANGDPIAATRGADLSGMSAARLSEAVVEPEHRMYVARRHARAPAVVVVSQTRIAHLEQWRNEAWIWVPLAVIFGGLGGLAATALVRQSPEAALRRALAKRAFVVFYQPIVELATGRCAGAEALVRWRRPDGTLLRPDLFIPLAEETGLVLALTDQVLENVVTELGALLRSEPVYVSINLSARDVASTRILGLAGRLLGTARIPAHRIAFEATERGFIDAANARPALRQYHDAGHRILIDDFGTGYSSLAQLQNLEVDAIKIDKSFIDVIGTEAATRSVVPDIAHMAKTLGLELIGEGVESEGQAAYLRAHGVAYGQGDLFGKPMPAQEFLRYVAGRPAASSSDG